MVLFDKLGTNKLFFRSYLTVDPENIATIDCKEYKCNSLRTATTKCKNNGKRNLLCTVCHKELMSMKDLTLFVKQKLMYSGINPNSVLHKNINKIKVNVEDEDEVNKFLNYPYVHPKISKMRTLDDFKRLVQ